MAKFHRNGRVLPERPTADLDRLVRAAPATLVSRFCHWRTLVLELGLVFMLFLPRRWRILCFFIVTAWQIPVILTANYTFLNYLVLVLGFLLLDDGFLLRVMPERWRAYIGPRIARTARARCRVAGSLRPVTYLPDRSPYVLCRHYGCRSPA